jgi:hypothetical protein
VLPTAGVPAARKRAVFPTLSAGACCREISLNSLIYLIGLVVVIMAVLTFFGLR